MKEHLEKAMRIVSDLVAYCGSEGADEFQIHMRRTGRVMHIAVSAPITSLDKTALDDLVQEMNLPRQHEVERDYWELGGELETHGDLTLAGMMVDGAKVEYKGGVLSIHTWRVE